MGKYEARILAQFQPAKSISDLADRIKLITKDIDAEIEAKDREILRLKTELQAKQVCEGG